MARTTTPRAPRKPRAPRTAPAPATASLAVVTDEPAAPAADVIDMAAWADRLGILDRPVPATYVYAPTDPLLRYLTPSWIEATESPVYDSVVADKGAPPRTVQGEAFAIEDAPAVAS